MKRETLKTVVVLLAMWLGVTAFNVTKAVHIDDTLYLSIARHIVHDPLHPMSGTVYWGNQPEPIHASPQQPSGFPYLLAAVMSVFGESDLAFHLLVSLFSLAAIVFFYLLARGFCRDHPLVLTALFCLSPAFIPSQNIMTDIPMLALWLVAFWAILTPAPPDGETRRFTIAACAIAAACLIKYTSLILIPILALDIVLRRRYRLLWTLVIPVATLLAWSAFNLYDYGGVHLLTRGIASPEWNPLERLTSWLICLGAVTPFSIIGLPMLSSRRAAWVIAAVALIAAFAVGLYTFPLHLLWSNSILQAVFVANGILLFGVTLVASSAAIFSARRLVGIETSRPVIILAAWALCSFLFIVLLSPFMAVRHALPVIPPILLILGLYAVPAVRKALLVSAVAVTVLLGALLGVSDWFYADAYRNAPQKLSTLPHGRTIWYIGHWGWQWYAEKAGFKPCYPGISKPADGDLLVAPWSLCSEQDPLHDFPGWAGSASLHTGVPAPLVFFRTMAVTGFYSSSVAVRPPWFFSAEPLETFHVYVFVQSS